MREERLNGLGTSAKTSVAAGCLTLSADAVRGVVGTPMRSVAHLLRGVALLLATAGLVAVAGCGQKGPLTLPGANGNTAAASAAPASGAASAVPR